VQAVHAQQAAAFSAEVSITCIDAVQNGWRNAENTSMRGLKIFFFFASIIIPPYFD